MEKPIIVLTGPTASGKTKISLEIARKYKGEVICADSMTVYRGMDIGTDKPTLLKECTDAGEANPDGSYNICGIRHHLLNILDPDEEFNAAIFQKKVRALTAEIWARGGTPLLVGGSNMYIDAFIYNFEIPNTAPDPVLRAKLEKKSTEELFSALILCDPDAEWTVDRYNRRRLVRALEVTQKTGIPFTKQKVKHTLPANILYLATSVPREVLYEEIGKRVGEMIRAGFIDEVKKLFEKYDHNTAMQAAGYRQLTEYLDGELTLEEAVEKTKQVHRNYAKRQLTWLKKNSDVIWVKNLAEADHAAKKFLGQKR